MERQSKSSRKKGVLLRSASSSVSGVNKSRSKPLRTYIEISQVEVVSK